MAVTSLWRVKGYVGKVILYAMNESKTTEKEIIETGNDDTTPESALRDLINYASRDDATNLKQFVSAINCGIDTVKEEMMETKKRFNKKDGTVAYHGYQSFAEGEVTPELAHRIGHDLAKELWGDKYEVLVTTHLDKDSHIHNHFVLNTVSFVDGVKFHRTKRDYQKMREVSDRLCREYSLSVIEHPKGHGKNYAEWRAEKNGEYTKNGIIRRDIDECIAVAMNEKQFYREMMSRGYTFNFDRKYATIFHPNFPKARRLKTLGEDYTPEAIREKLRGYRIPTPISLPEQDDPEKVFFDGDRKNRDVFKNRQTIYVHFVCGVRVVRERPDENRELMRLLGDEIIKFDKRVEEQNLMLDHHLFSDEDIDKYKSAAQTEMDELIAARQDLRNAMKRAVRSDDVQEQEKLRGSIQRISARLRIVRRDIAICDRILSQGQTVEQKLTTVKDHIEKSKGKEDRTQNEHIWRRSRTGR